MDRVEDFTRWIENLRQQDEERFDGSFCVMLEHISGCVERGEIDQERQADLFARLRETLRGQREWVMADPFRIMQVRNWRESYARSHWWWWIEEL